MNHTLTRTGLWTVSVAIEGVGEFQLRAPSLREAVFLQETLEQGKRTDWIVQTLDAIIVSAPEVPGLPTLPAPGDERRRLILSDWPFPVTEPLIFATAELDCPWSAFLKAVKDGQLTPGKGGEDQNPPPPSQSGS